MSLLRSSPSSVQRGSMSTSVTGCGFGVPDTDGSVPLPSAHPPDRPQAADQRRIAALEALSRSRRSTQMPRRFGFVLRSCAMRSRQVLVDPATVDDLGAPLWAGLRHLPNSLA